MGPGAGGCSDGTDYPTTRDLRLVTVCAVRNQADVRTPGRSQPRSEPRKTSGWILRMRCLGPATSKLAAPLERSASPRVGGDLFMTPGRAIQAHLGGAVTIAPFRFPGAGTLGGAAQRRRAPHDVAHLAEPRCSQPSSRFGWRIGARRPTCARLRQPGCYGAPSGVLSTALDTSSSGTRARVGSAQSMMPDRQGRSEE